MRGVLTRHTTTPQGTPGALVLTNALDRVLTMVTLELPWMDNRRTVSCIPEGAYECVWRQSTTKGWCYHVLDVPGRSGILIHVGNWGGDRSRGWRSDIEGCIVPGRSHGQGTPPGYRRPQLMVTRSAVACANLRNHMGMMPFTLEIRT